MSGRRRVVLKFIWMAVLVASLVLLAQVRYDFVYQGF
jgi:hypothetical protein